MFFGFKINGFFFISIVFVAVAHCRKPDPALMKSMPPVKWPEKKQPAVLDQSSFIKCLNLCMADDLNNKLPADAKNNKCNAECAPVLQ